MARRRGLQVGNCYHGVTSARLVHREAPSSRQQRSMKCSGAAERSLSSEARHLACPILREESRSSRSPPPCGGGSHSDQDTLDRRLAGISESSWAWDSRGCPFGCGAHTNLAGNGGGDRRFQRIRWCFVMFGCPTRLFRERRGRQYRRDPAGDLREAQHLLGRQRTLQDVTFTV